MLAFQLSSLVLLLAVVVCWAIPKKLNNDDYKHFLAVVIYTIIYLIFDFASTIAALDNLPSKYFLFKIFIILLVGRCFIEFFYLDKKIAKNDKLSIFIKASLVVAAIGSIMIAVFPITVELSERGIDVQGLSIYSGYISALIVFVMMIIYLTICKNQINKWSRVCFITTLAMWGIAVIIQFFVDKTGVISIAFVLTLTAIFAFFENPLNYRNHDFNCFKDNFVDKYLDALLAKKQSGFVFSLDVMCLNNIQSDNEKIIEFKKNLINGLNKNKDLKIFISVESEIIAISKEVSKLDSYIEYIGNELDKLYISVNFKDQLRSEFIYCKDINLLNNSNEFIMYMAYARKETKNISGRRVQFEINNELIDSVKGVEKVKEEVKDALEEDRVKAFVQPIYSVERKAFISAEALVRISKTNGVYMTPYQFIPIAESCGLDIPIGYRMIEQVCKILSSSLYGHLFEFIDVNLSIAECEQESLASRIINLTQKYNVEPQRINFEITESGFINKMDSIKANIKVLTDYGFGFSLDDFGSGESNLDYLVKLPVKYLKLDMNMIWAYFKSENAKHTVLSIIKIAHEMGLKVVAEGVETKEQFEELSTKGVDFIQGYYFYRPLTIYDYDFSLKENEE